MSVGVYRSLSLGMAVVFAAVGLLFLILGNDVPHFFGAPSTPGGWPPIDNGGERFFLALAVAYMYVVALIAFLMYRRPGDLLLPLLLANAKLASAAVCLLLFLATTPHLIYLVNCVVDGMIGLFAIVMRRTAGRFGQ